VLNKADRVTNDERAQAIAFARTVVERRLRRPVGLVFEVSATERLAHAGPRRDWDAFVVALESLVATSGAHLVRESARRGLRRIVAQLVAMTRDRRAALLRPISEN